MSDNEFYIGHEEKAPPATVRFLRTRIGLLLIIAVVLGAGLAAMQSDFYPAFFDFGNPLTFTGRLDEDPVPALVVSNSATPPQNVVLVGIGKHGAGPSISGRHGQTVELQGTRIKRENSKLMLELVPGSIRPSEVEAPPLPQPEPLGEWTLVGEIVDSKCYLGVMNPGEGKVHKACAINCIRGGIPPALRINNGERELLLLLVNSLGEPINDQILDRIAVPVRVSGEVERHGWWLVMKADPSNIRRLRR
ncbi:MAG TPA: hypothetical protein VLV83_24700 [Acidobacteriota bacterium]|nr:hypothetical protein [Acidobacteriota bacterium]